MAVQCPFCGGETIEYLSAEQTARSLNLSPKTIRKYIKQGRFPGSTLIPGVNKTSMWRIPVTAVLPLVEAKNDISRK